jgi:ketosteroid isomerase-like protein
MLLASSRFAVNVAKDRFSMEAVMQTRSRFRLLGLLLLAAPVAVPAQETQDTMKVAAALRAERAGLNKALTALNAKGSVAFFADDAIVDFQGQTFTGKMEIEGWLTQAFSGLTSLKFGAPSFKIADAEVVETVQYTVGTPEGEQPGTTETIWRRGSDNKWKVVRMRGS